MARLVAAIVLRRLLTALPMILILSAIVFFILRAIPADPIAMLLPPGATAADVAQLRAAYGLDRPLPLQYWLWLTAALSGNLGQSIAFREPVTRLIEQSFPATAELALCSLLFGLLFSLAGGTWFYSLKTRIGRALAELSIVASLSIPSFLWAILFILLFGVALPILPFTGRVSGSTMLPDITGFALLDLLITGRLREWGDAALHLLMPALSLALGFCPPVIRVLRSSLMDAAMDDYATYARQRGVREARVLCRHMLRNAALPTVTLVGVQFGFLFGGTLLVELIFSIPGLGNLTVQAVRNHDLPVLQGAALVFCVVVLLISTAIDAVYVVLNPRLRQRH